MIQDLSRHQPVDIALDGLNGILTETADMPTEQFKLNFTEILWTYTVQTPDMQVKGNVTAGWSLTHNRSLTAFS